MKTEVKRIKASGFRNKTLIYVIIKPLKWLTAKL